MTRRSEADKAATLLVNYFETIARKAGMRWDRDYTVEIADAVDHIINAAVLQMRDDLVKLLKSNALGRYEQ